MPERTPEQRPRWKPDPDNPLNLGSHTQQRKQGLPNSGIEPSLGEVEQDNIAVSPDVEDFSAGIVEELRGSNLQKSNLPRADFKTNETPKNVQAGDGADERALPAGVPPPINPLVLRTHRKSGEVSSHTPADSSPMISTSRAGSEAVPLSNPPGGRQRHVSGEGKATSENGDEHPSGIPISQIRHRPIASPGPKPKTPSQGRSTGQGPAHRTVSTQLLKLPQREKKSEIMNRYMNRRNVVIALASAGGLGAILTGVTIWSKNREANLPKATDIAVKDWVEDKDNKYVSAKISVQKDQSLIYWGVKPQSLLFFETEEERDKSLADSIQSDPILGDNERQIIVYSVSSHAKLFGYVLLTGGRTDHNIRIVTTVAGSSNPKDLLNAVLEKEFPDKNNPYRNIVAEMETDSPH